MVKQVVNTSAVLALGQLLLLGAACTASGEDLVPVFRDAGKPLPISADVGAPSAQDAGPPPRSPTSS